MVRLNIPSAVLPVLQFPIYSKLVSEQSLIFLKVSGVERPSGEAVNPARNEDVSPRGDETCIFSPLALLHFYEGISMRKLAPEQVSYWDDFFISYRVYIMTGSFHISLLKGTLHVDKVHLRFKIANITDALPVYQRLRLRLPAERLHTETCQETWSFFGFT